MANGEKRLGDSTRVIPPPPNLVGRRCEVAFGDTEPRAFGTIIRDDDAAHVMVIRLDDGREVSPTSEPVAWSLLP